MWDIKGVSGASRYEGRASSLTSLGSSVESAVRAPPFPTRWAGKSMASTSPVLQSRMGIKSSG